jgi:hypothetical protein
VVAQRVNKFYEFCLVFRHFPVKIGFQTAAVMVLKVDLSVVFFDLIADLPNLVLLQLVGLMFLGILRHVFWEGEGLLHNRLLRLYHHRPLLLVFPVLHLLPLLLRLLVKLQGVFF